MEIIPAVMPDNYADLCAKVERVHGLVPLVQIDIMDGSFVSSRSWPYTEGGTKKNDHFFKLVDGDESFPHWETLDYEFDLMIARPEDHLDEWISLGAARLIFHHEAVVDTQKLFANDLFRDGARTIGDDVVIELGVAIDVDTPLDALDPYLEKVDFVQLMGIKKIGYQGEPFAEETLDRVNKLRTRYPLLTISVDGGVNEETAPLLTAAGADRLVVGSALFNADDISVALQSLVHDNNPSHK